MTVKDIERLRKLGEELNIIYDNIKAKKKNNMFYIKEDNLNKIKDSISNLGFVVGYEEAKQEQREEYYMNNRKSFRVYSGGKK